MRACVWVTCASLAGALELGDVEQPGIGDLWAMGQPIGFGAAFWKVRTDTLCIASIIGRKTLTSGGCGDGCLQIVCDTYLQLFESG